VAAQMILQGYLDRQRDKINVDETSG
jgi:hypothetical protein